MQPKSIQANVTNFPRRQRHRKTRKGTLIFAILLAVLIWGFWKLPESSTISSPVLSTPIQQSDDWQLLLVNRDHPLPEDYTLETVQLSNGERVDERIYPALQQMFDDMRAAGVYPVVASGYRTTEEQQQILDDKIAAYEQEGYTRKEAETLAEDWVALPGTSEHQLGLAVDINADGIHSTGQEVYNWLLENSARYGFIKRYPEDKTHITGISNEPWHYRYVGEEAAKEMTRQNLCLEEYLAVAQP